MSARTQKRWAFIIGALALIVTAGYIGSMRGTSAAKPEAKTESSINSENGFFCWAFGEAVAEEPPGEGQMRTAEWYVRSGERPRLKDISRGPTPELLDLAHRVGYAATDEAALVQASHFDRLWAADRGRYCVG